jgi:hypothetical protein
MIPLPPTMTHRELWEALQISRRQFYALKATGLFDRLESPVPHRYSREKVEAFIAGRSVHQRAWRVPA